MPQTPDPPGVSLDLDVVKEKAFEDDSADQETQTDAPDMQPTSGVADPMKTGVY